MITEKLGDEAEGALVGGVDRAIPVTFVTSNGEVGGGELYLESLLRGLGEAWIDRVIVLVNGEFPRLLGEQGYRVDVLPARGKIASANAVGSLRRYLVRHRTRVVHAHGAKAAALVSLAASGTGAPVLWVKLDGTLDGPIAGVIARRCHGVIGVSGSAIAGLRGRALARAQVVYPGIPTYNIAPGAGRALVVEALGCPPHAEVVVVSGRLCPPKGQHELIEVAPSILRRRPELRIALLGGENRAYAGYVERLRRRASQLGVGERVSFLGHRSLVVRSLEDAVRFVSGCDLLVAPSMRERISRWREGFGFSVVEAMAVGTPVVAYESGSLPEVLGPCGSTVEERRRDELATAVVALLEDPARRRELADCGRQRARARFRRADAIDGMRQRYLEAAAG